MGSEAKKPIKIILFHAEWCGHCVDFKPTWEKMKENKDAWKNIDFEEYESGVLSTLPEKLKTINGESIEGFPTIKIKVFEKEYNYRGPRDQDKIFGFVLDHLKNDKRQNKKMLKEGTYTSKLEKEQTHKPKEKESESEKTKSETLKLDQSGGNVNEGNYGTIKTINKMLSRSDLMIVGLFQHK